MTHAQETPDASPWEGADPGSDRMRPAPGALRLAVLSGTHLCPPGTPDSHWIAPQPLGESRRLLRSALKAIVRHNVNAIAVLGDISNDGDRDQIDYLIASAAGLAVPVFMVAGNRDVQRDPGLVESAVAHSLRPAVRYPGPEGTRFAEFVIAASRITPAGHGRDCAATPPALSQHGPVPVIWLAHHPVLSMASILAAADLPYAGDITNRDEAEAALAAHPAPVVALTGHLHVRAHAISGNVLQIACPALIESPHEVSIIDCRQDPGSGAISVRRSCLSVVQAPAAFISVPAGLDPPSQQWAWNPAGWPAATGRTARRQETRR